MSVTTGMSFTEGAEDKLSDSGMRTPPETMDTVQYIILDYPLEPVSGPIALDHSDPNLQIADATMDTSYAFPTVAEKNSFGTLPDLLARRTEALELAAAFLDRTCGKNKDIDPDYEHLRRHHKLKFEQILDVLDAALISKLCQFNEEDTFGYKPSDSYTKLIDMLQDLCNKLVEAGLPDPPTVPFWGKSREDYQSLWTANNYEILSICFRYDVEKYLGGITQFLDKDLQIITRMIAIKQRKKIIEPPPHLQASIPEQEQKPDISKDSTPLVIQDSSLAAIRNRQSSMFSRRPRTVSTAAEAGLSFQPRKMTTASGFQALLQERPRSSSINPLKKISYKDEPSDPSDSSDNDDDDGNKGSVPKLPKRSSAGKDGRHGYRAQSTASTISKEAHFDLKLKTDFIPEWDGNPDTLAQWVLKINSISKKSATIFEQLGQLVPTRLRKKAEDWYYSLPEENRESAEQNWDTLKEIIAGYYMNRTWLDKQKMRARTAHYREPGHSQELPSDFYIRKSQMLTLVFNMTDSEIIMEVMTSGPSGWTSILTPHLYETVVELQSALKYHEDILVSIGDQEKRRDYTSSYTKYYSSPSTSSSKFKKNSSKGSGFGSNTVHRAKTYAIGYTPALGKPQFPKDDANRTKRKRTPAEAGARPCRHCGSGMHWDPECKHAIQGAKRVTANFAKYNEEYFRALNDYEGLYAASDLDETSEESSATEVDEEHSSSESENQDF